MAPSSFPVGARVVLTGLAKAPQYNGKVGVVQSVPTQDGRQHVHVEDLDKAMALRVSNLKHEPKSVKSLSIKELKTILLAKENGTSSDDTNSLTGLDKSDLQTRVSQLISSEEEIADILAHASSSSASSAASATRTTTPSVSREDLKSGADRVSQMSPDQLRQQAMMMRSMDPAAIRRMNPQMAGLTDAQIKMAADQMEQMANNPEMLKMAVNQMKTMSPEELERQRQQVMATTPTPSTSSSRTSNSTTTGTATAQQGNSPSIKNQMDQLQNMDPEQLKSKANMMRTMDPAMVRNMNPQLANMTDAQIRAAADQMDLMASNPEMMKMAAEQMKHMSAEDMQRAMQQGPAASSATSSSAAAPAAMNPAEMMQNMDPAQLKQMLNMVKKNPDLLKQMLKTQGVGSQISEEQLNKGVELFSQMDEKQLEKAIGMMTKVQRVAQPFVNGWKKVNDGCFRGQLSKVIFTMVMGLAFYGGWRLLFGGAPSDVDMGLNSLTASSEPLAAPSDDLEQEF